MIDNNKIEKKTSISVLDVILVFFLIFGVQFHSIVNSTYIAFLLLLVLPLAYTEMSVRVKTLVRNGYFLKTFGLYIFVILFVFLSSTFTGGYDNSLIFTIVNTLVNFFFCGILVCYLYTRRYKARDVIRLLVLVFLIQSIIEVLALLFPFVLSFVQSMHSDAYVVEKLEMYGARKGLALAGSIFFSLSAVFGMLFIFYGSLLEFHKKTFINIFSGLLLMIGGVLSGRTAFIGIFIGMVYMFFLNKKLSSHLNGNKLLPTGLKLILILLGLILFSFLFLPEKTIENIFELSAYFFEFAFSYFESGKMSTTSTDGMFEMYFIPELKTILVGDGRYMSYDGLGYYMETDIGYMRNILLFGVIGLCILIYIEYHILFKYKVKLNSNEKLFSIFLFIYLIVVHAKGEVLVYSVMIHRVLFIYFIFKALESNYKVMKR